MTTFKVIFPDGTESHVEDCVLRFTDEDGTVDDMPMTDMLDGYFAGTELCDAIIDSQDVDSGDSDAILEAADVVQGAIEYLMACNGYTDDSEDVADDDSEEFINFYQG